MASTGQSVFEGQDANLESHSKLRVINASQDELHEASFFEAVESQPRNEDQDSGSQPASSDCSSADETNQVATIASSPPPMVQEATGSDLPDGSEDCLGAEVKGKLKEAETPAGPNKEPQDQHPGNPSGDSPSEHIGEPSPTPAETPRDNIALNGGDDAGDLLNAADGTQEGPATRDRQETQDAGQPETYLDTASASPIQEDESHGQPATKSHHNGESGRLDNGSDSPMGEENDDNDKEGSETQEPPLSASSTTKSATAHEKAPESRQQDEPNSYKKSPSQPPSMGSGHTTSARMEISPHTHHAPIFFMADTDDPGFAPFASSEDSPSKGETMADILANDQISRAERLTGPLTEEAKNVIRGYFATMGQGDRSPSEASETSEPTTNHTTSLPVGNEVQPPSSLAAGPSDNSSFTFNRRRVAQPANTATSGYPPHAHVTDLWDRVDALASQLAKSEDQRADDQRLIDDTSDEVGQLRRQQKEVEKQLKSVVAELQDVKKTQRAARLEAERQRRLQTQAPPRPGRPGFTAVALAVVVLVWLVTEAMLHSKRLSEGYGPFVNGGFNGLGSVVIFGTWGKFLGFNAAMVFLGVFSVLGALEE